MFNIQDLIDDEKCYVEMRKLDWSEGMRCPKCRSGQVTKRGKHNRDKLRYRCHGCQKQFYDLTDSIFEGHRQPLKVWIMRLPLIGLNLPNQ